MPPPLAGLGPSCCSVSIHLPRSARHWSARSALPPCGPTRSTAWPDAQRPLTSSLHEAATGTAPPALRPWPPSSPPMADPSAPLHTSRSSSAVPLRDDNDAVSNLPALLRPHSHRCRPLVLSCLPGRFGRLGESKEMLLELGAQRGIGVDLLV